MKIIILSILTCGILTGCSENYRRQCVQDEFKGCELFSFPDITNRFLVRTEDGTILFVYCDYPFRGTPSSHSVAFYPRKN